MSSLIRRFPLLLPGFIATVSAMAIVVSISTLSLRSTAMQGRFSTWERENSLGPGEAFVWTALLLATNEETPKKTPGELRPLEDRMRRVFGYNQFRIVDEAENIVSRQGLRWFVPGESLYLGLKLRGDPQQGQQGVNFEIWRRRQLLVEADAIVRPGSPLFIRGPQKGNGQLIFVIMLARLPQPEATE